MKLENRRQSVNVIDRRNELQDPISRGFRYTGVTGILVFDAINKLLFDQDEVTLRELPNQLEAMEKLLQAGSLDK